MAGLMYYILVPLHWTCIIIAELAALVVGVFVVPVAVLFAKQVDTQRKHPHWDDWVLLRLPKWAYPWDNKRDGCLGDIRGNYWKDYPHPIMRTAYLKKVNWLAFRNPINTLSRYIPGFACNLNKHYKTVRLLAGQYAKVDNRIGQEGFQVTLCGTFFPYMGLYYVSRWNVRQRHLCCVLGHKIHPQHTTIDLTDPDRNWKGFTVRVGLKELK